MASIDFGFKPIIPDTLAAPTIEVAPFYKGVEGRHLICIVDTGADYTTLPIDIAMSMGISFSNPRPDMKEPWLEILAKVSSGGVCDYQSFLRTLYDNGMHIPSKMSCACGNEIDSVLFPIEIKIDDRKFFTMVNWTDANAPPLLGRFGILDQVKEAVFNKRELRGHFLLD
jgi:hypothetical protein